METRREGTEELPEPIASLLHRIKTEPATRMKLLSCIADGLIELGVRPEDVTFVTQLDVIERPSEEPEPNIVIISTSDSKKNSKSVVIF